MIGWSLGLLFIALCSRHARQRVVSCWRWLRLVSSDLRLQCKDQLFNDLLRVMYVSRMTFYCSFLKQILITAKLSDRYLARNVSIKARLFRIQHLLRGNGLKILIRRLAKLPDNYKYAQKNKIRRHWQLKTIPDLSSLLQLVFVRWLKTNKSLRFHSSVCRLWKRHILRYQDELSLQLYLVFLCHLDSSIYNPGRNSWNTSWDSPCCPFTKLTMIGVWTFTGKILGFSHLCEEGGVQGSEVSSVPTINGRGSRSIGNLKPIYRAKLRTICFCVSIP